MAKKQKTPMLELFREMSIGVKLSTIWIVLLVFGALYAKLDVQLDDALPLKDPLFQYNGINPETGLFGDGDPYELPSGQHFLGTDGIVRDAFSRVVHGAWVSLTVAIVSAVFGLAVGGFLGSLVGFVRGKTETIIMALIDVILAFPALVLLLAMVSIFEVRNLYVISLVIGLLSIPAYTRVARANSLAISNREFVLAAKAIGTKPSRILFKEIIPNVYQSLLSYALVAAALVVVVEGTLSFLGLSVSPPSPTWGNMINEARANIKQSVWPVVFPSLALTFTVLAFNQVGDFFQKRNSVRGSAL